MKKTRLTKTQILKGERYKYLIGDSWLKPYVNDFGTLKNIHGGVLVHRDQFDD